MRGKEMKKVVIILLFLFIFLFSGCINDNTKNSDDTNKEIVKEEDNEEMDTFNVTDGKLTITFIGHGSLQMDYNGKIIHIDPVAQFGDYTKMPAADLILITHHHGDHLDSTVITMIKKDDTIIVLNEESFKQLGEGIVLKNEDTIEVLGITIEAVHAYNTTEGRDKFHPEGRDNGYILTIGGNRIYVAGDTENTDEMKSLTDIDIAFLPMNQPYTMTPEQVADAAIAFNPAILYPYHYGDTDTSILTSLLKDKTDIEVRIRNLQ